MEKPPFVETLNQVLYGKSSNPFAEENIDDSDFQDGYRIGEKDVDGGDWSEVWLYAWRVTYQEIRSNRWESWKRGYHAGKLSAITLI